MYRSTAKTTMDNQEDMDQMKNSPETDKEKLSEFFKAVSAPIIRDDDKQKSHPTASFRKYEGLTYDEALKYLKEGTPVRLPEWQGIWFQIGEQLFVFTRDNEILDTPHIDKYSPRNDWTTSTGDVPELPIRFVKALRKRADSLLIHINSGEAGKSREISLAATSLQLGQMWLGKELEELDAQYPYPESSDPKSSVIEKRTDQADVDSFTYITGLETETARVKALRNDIQVLLDMADFAGRAWNRRKPAWGVACDKFIEAKMWLGQQLNNIRLASEAGK